ncbi:DUF488 domain-containing protein [Bdellovibrio reynosensis]|uniref:DUF488 domain-containing protein n=1 Tax=Bdellovibrio reynosensis TaxID=2835041 RepID=A0ABY4C500_9BACT|nr:DUF488 domain-containing protein [Bdellovibrio reynosensis]UOE99813.1 DUF488 domain-containing protein [Bdellovibrio reynosensis]
MTIYTVGYEGCDIDQFLEGLKKNKVSYIIDIRKNPVSRKKGFSKSRLRERLEEKGIGYIHYGTLGTPNAWRKEEKAKLITRNQMFGKFVDEIIPKTQKELQEVVELVKQTDRAALLCYEADASDCHRHFVAEELRNKTKMKVIDLDVLPEGSDLGMFGKPLKKAKKAS